MKILLIEDDPNKKTQVCSFLERTIDGAVIIEKSSFKSGLKEILMNEYDLILLDMSMPTFDITVNESGGRILPFAGKEILRQMKRKSIFTPTIIVTQFEKFGEYDRLLHLDELNEELAKDYSKIYIDTVNYNPTNSSWINELTKNIDKIGFGKSL